MQAIDVAQFMLEELNKKNELYQEDIVWIIQDKFGKEFVYDNANGNLAISKEVLASFKKIRGENVKWIKGGRYWELQTNA